MNGQREVVVGKPADLRSGDSPQPAARDRTYIARLDFLTSMRMLRWEVSDAAVVTNALGEERVRIGTVSVPVLEKVTELLRRNSEMAKAKNSALAESDEDECSPFSVSS